MAEKCPCCGQGVSASRWDDTERWICGTWRSPTGELIQSQTCCIAQLEAENARLKAGLRDILDMHTQDSCQCVDPPGEEADGADGEPADHQQHCPIYLAAYIDNLLAGIDPADPDAAAEAAQAAKETTT